MKTLKTLLSVCLDDLGLDRSKPVLKSDGSLDILKIVYVGSFIWKNIEAILKIQENQRVISICKMMGAKHTCMTQLIVNSCLLRIVLSYDHLSKIRDKPNVVFVNEECCCNFQEGKAYIQLIFSKRYEDILKLYRDTQDVSVILDDLNNFEFICGSHYGKYSLTPATSLLIQKALNAYQEECIICSSIVGEEGFFGCSYCSTLVCGNCVHRVERCPCCKKDL